MLRSINLLALGLVRTRSRVRQLARSHAPRHDAHRGIFPDGRGNVESASTPSPQWPL